MITLNKILKEEFTSQEIKEIKVLLSKYELDKTIGLIKNTLQDSDIQIKAFGFIQIFQFCHFRPYKNEKNKMS